MVVDPEALNDLETLLVSLRPLLIISPPRSASTALARAFWNHTAVSSYVHEPCGRFYHQGSEIRTITEQVQAQRPAPGSTLVKLMSFQLGSAEVASAFLRSATKPPIFPLRDPRLTIESRLRQVLADLLAAGKLGKSDKETVEAAIRDHEYAAVDHLISERFLSSDQIGFSSLSAQVELCRREGIDFVLVDIDRLRSAPAAVLPELCRRWGLPFEESMLEWKQERFPNHGILAAQSSWFDRVSASSGFEPPTEKPISRASLPSRLRPAARESKWIYQALIDAREGVP